MRARRRLVRAFTIIAAAAVVTLAAAGYGIGANLLEGDDEQAFRSLVAITVDSARTAELNSKSFPDSPAGHQVLRSRDAITQVLT
ncbi:MAG: hypothetical protein ABIQ18_37500, partial [Umezawaea sp.]